MKKLLPFLLLCCQFATAQITFNMSDVPVAGQTQRVAIDTVPLPSVNFGNKGANQVYDFSNLTVYKYDTVEFRVPTNSQKTTCPNADAATTLDGVNFLLTNTDTPNTKLLLEGFEGQICPGQTISAAYSQKPEIHRFPTTYQSNFSGTGYLQKTVSASQVCQSFPVSNVRLTTTVNYTDTVDGWGKVITPLGTYKCLRKQRKETTTSLIEAQVFGVWNTVSNTTNTTIRYTYLTKEGKGSIINFNYDTANVLQSVQWSMTPPTAPIADFTFVNGAAGLVTFTDASDFYPTSWAWTFGDGGTSTLQNPTHTYTVNNTYNVCLTATNAGGSHQVCKQVTVSNAPLTPVANFTSANPSGGLVNFTDQSTNTPTSWAWTFGDGGTGNTQNPSHVYTANNTYNVCLTATNAAGSNQICKNVVVSGISAANNAPIAVTDTVTVTGGSSQIIHVAGNDIDPDNDQLCINAVWGSQYATEYIGGTCDMILYEPDSSFSGADTAYYRVCDNGTPVLCDTGMVIFNVNELNYPPVAVNDAATTTQPNPVTVNVGTNDSDANGNNFCVTAVYGSPAFTIAPTGNCTSVLFTPDSSFTGNDTCWYVICDNGTPALCDTGRLIVTVNANASLLPVASFTSSPSLTACTGNGTISGWQEYTVTSTSTNTTSYLWQVSYLKTYCTDTVKSYFTPTASFTPNYLFVSCGGPEKIVVCLTATNSFGSSTKCDTSCITFWQSISETALSNISLYPNPSNNVLTIDMQNNQDEITRNYTAIEIYNTVGAKVLSVNRANESKVINLNVAGLPNGMYAATITGANNERRTLGRFTVAH